MAIAPKLTERSGWTDYLSWPDDALFEFLDGEALAMAPPIT